jgi:LuxR family maltose regulon positive regulatory protein
MINPLVVHSAIEETVETEDGKIFELNSSAGSAWLKSATSFRFVPRGDNKPYTVRKEAKKGGNYWYGYRRVTGELHKRYIGKSSELSTAKLEEIAEALNTRQQSRVTQVAEVNQRVAETVTDNPVVERVTALEMQLQALWESLEALRSELSRKVRGVE